MLLIFIALALVLWLLICVYFYQAQDGIMYETDPKVPSLKRASVYAGQAVQINPDGEPEISNTSWYFPASKGMGTILFFHGNNGNIETRTGWMQFALAQGWGLMMVGYRGYGGNAGTPNQAGLTTDALAAYDWLVHEAEVPAGEINIFGHSLGSAIACLGLKGGASLTLFGDDHHFMRMIHVRTFAFGSGDTTTLIPIALNTSDPSRSISHSISVRFSFSFSVSIRNSLNSLGIGGINIRQAV